MAHQIIKQSPLMLMVALLLVAAAAPLAHGALPLVGTALNAAQVNGTMCCAPNGHCPDGPPLVGVKVKLVCTTALGSSPVTVGECVTDQYGRYYFTLTDLVHTLLGGLLGGGNLPCRVVVDFPINQPICKELSAAGGFLYGVPYFLKYVLSSLLGVVGCYSVPLLSYSH